MFFSKFDKIVYNGISATNITNSILLKYRPMNNTTLYTFHKVADGETPESLADHYYRNSEDHWVILLLNNIVDPVFDWVMSGEQLKSMVRSKYGDKVDDIHHLFNRTTRRKLDQVDTADYVYNGRVVKPLPVHISPVTNYEYELTRNDAKRDVKILAPRYLQDFKNQFEDLMSRNFNGNITS